MNLNRILKLAGLPEREAPQAVILETTEGATVTLEADGTVTLSTDGHVTIVAADITVEAEEVVVESEETSTPELDNKEENKGTTVKVPADVSSAITKRISELKAAIAEFDDGGVKPNAIEALEQIAADLKLEDGHAKAALFYGTLMSPITDLFPPKLVKFIHSK